MPRRVRYQKLGFMGFSGGQKNRFLRPKSGGWRIRVEKFPAMGGHMYLTLKNKFKIQIKSQKIPPLLLVLTKLHNKPTYLIRHPPKWRRN